MWLGERNRGGQPDSASVGQVTVGGINTAVYTDGERRGASLFAPGGYYWVPRAGQSVLVLKNGEHEVCCLDREVTDPPEGLCEGEIMVCSDGASVTLKNDGSILISGNITVNGRLTVNGNEIG